MNLFQRLRMLWSEKGKAGGKPPASTVDVGEIVLPQTYQIVAERLRTPALLSTNHHLNSVVKADRDGTHPKIIEFYVKFEKALRAHGIAMYAHNFYRSPEWQAELYRQRRTKAKAGQSPHNWGCAVDIVFTEWHWNLPTRSHTEERAMWNVVGQIGKEVARRMNAPIVWGGDWDFWDPAHWELAHWRDLRAIQREHNAEGKTASTDAQRFATLDAEYEKRRKQTS